VRGGKVVALLIPMSSTVRLSFASGVVLDAIPGWEQAMSLPLGAKLTLLSDPRERQALGELAQRAETRVHHSDWKSKVIFHVVAPENRPYLGRTVGDIANELGRDSWDVLCDIAVADGLQTSFGTPVVETTDDWVTCVDLARDNRVVLGASDAGAHLDMIEAFSYPTVLLERAVRQHRLMSLEEAVHLISDVPAQLYGIRDRGRIAKRYYADLVVLDPTTIGSGEVSVRNDLPAGACRLHAGARGVECVIVNGVPTVVRGELTGARSGSVLRSGVDTTTPSMV
jgi:N-acyl-D-aspartate/D-glutamate deacylase